MPQQAAIVPAVDSTRSSPFSRGALAAPPCAQRGRVRGRLLNGMSALAGTSSQGRERDARRRDSDSRIDPPAVSRQASAGADRVLRALRAAATQLSPRRTP